MVRLPRTCLGNGVVSHVLCVSGGLSTRGTESSLRGHLRLPPFPSCRSSSARFCWCTSRSCCSSFAFSSARSFSFTDIRLQSCPNASYVKQGWQTYAAEGAAAAPAAEAPAPAGWDKHGTLGERHTRATAKKYHQQTAVLSPQISHTNRESTNQTATPTITTINHHHHDTRKATTTKMTPPFTQNNVDSSMHGARAQ